MKFLPDSRFRRLAATAVLAVLVSVPGPLGAQRMVGTADRADREAIVHVLNRITFGPRPGDIERVQRMGLDAFIEEQLNPERIANTALDARLEPMTTLTMSSRELAEEFLATRPLE